MTVDKFGRRSQRGRAIRGPKGEGFNLTPQGNYDMRNKRLENVDDPVDERDALNLKTFNAGIVKFMISDSKVFNAQTKRITNIADPEIASDCATKQYVDKKVINRDLSEGSGKRHKEPLADKDTLTYLKKNSLLRSGSSFDAKNTRIKNLADAVEPGDAVSKQYLNKNTLTLKDGKEWDLGDKRLTGLATPTQPKDSVNLDYINGNVMTKFNDYDWDSRYAKIRYLSDPEQPTDAVNLKYLQYTIADLSYTLYKKMADGSQRVEKTDWIANSFRRSWEDMFNWHK